MSCGESRGSLGLLADLWLENALVQIGSRYGRLVYFSSLLDRDARRYRHPGLSQVVGDTEANRILQEGHRRTFDEWLCLSLEQQKADLDLYLSALGEDARTVLEAWVRARPCGNLPPLSAEEAERRLFLADLEALSGVMNGQLVLLEAGACH